MRQSSFGKKLAGTNNETNLIEYHADTKNKFVSTLQTVAKWIYFAVSVEENQRAHTYMFLDDSKTLSSAKGFNSLLNEKKKKKCTGPK